MSKGDIRRPRQVDRETFDRNWEKVFGKRESRTAQNPSNPSEIEEKTNELGQGRPGRQ